MLELSKIIVNLQSLSFSFCDFRLLLHLLLSVCQLTSTRGSSKNLPIINQRLLHSIIYTHHRLCIVSIACLKTIRTRFFNKKQLCPCVFGQNNRPLPLAVNWYLSRLQLLALPNCIGDGTLPFVSCDKTTLQKMHSQFHYHLL